eukprot:TRINITY_DN61820_c0_g1_i1.p1 TRINITY_DN61820_c0_g1~~TRINITY_DN61820_c0_g1_i1.p1  ORF type:complete len:409 (+),score=60.52 TRINITY_DN61820_c0_g1_i1:261-1487(+)
MALPRCCIRSTTRAGGRRYVLHAAVFAATTLPAATATAAAALDNLTWGPKRNVERLEGYNLTHKGSERLQLLRRESASAASTDSSPLPPFPSPRLSVQADAAAMVFDSAGAVHQDHTVAATLVDARPPNGRTGRRGAYSAASLIAASVDDVGQARRLSRTPRPKPPPTERDVEQEEVAKLPLEKPPRPTPPPSANKLEKNSVEEELARLTGFREARLAQDKLPKATSGGTYVLSGVGEDCPDYTFAIKSRSDCQVAVEMVNAELTLLELPAVADLSVRNAWDQRPYGCVLHCPLRTHCTASFNDKLGIVNSSDLKVRRYCRDYFRSSNGRCREFTEDGAYLRRISGHGNYRSMEDCKTECLKGPMHSQWCEAFEVVDPFENVCNFFKGGSVGDGTEGTFCYTKGTSTK